MKKVLIAGASGMIGNIILDHCLSSSKVGEIISLVRKKSNTTHSKLKEVIIDDFTDYDKHQDLFKNIDSAFFCIGVYTGSVSDKLFKEITVDYAVSFAKMLKEHSPNAKLSLLSGAGADRTEKSKTSFALYKGMAENQIDKLGLEFYTFRPSYIFPVKKRIEPNLMYSIMRNLYPILRLLGSKFSIKSTELAKAMCEVGIKGTDKKILENKDLIQYLKEQSEN
ncbi:NAD-dependent epimerase/dehydratase family protein [Algoriphagus sp. PAP.12]|uniref:NAD-dependent epimerase/dehydratase family protein n=1 Tax=Algoriphagus sp. PAP.12 TaxID=2996678 RepID=UPI00227D33A5|nr:NAD-dependent epimerase/dehydratase family protein [Algoriphagus sp. PAP.12]